MLTMPAMASLLGNLTHEERFSHHNLLWLSLRHFCWLFIGAFAPQNVMYSTAWARSASSLCQDVCRPLETERKKLKWMGWEDVWRRICHDWMTWSKVTPAAARLILTAAPSRYIIPSTECRPVQCLRIQHQIDLLSSNPNKHRQTLLNNTVSSANTTNIP